MEEEKKLISEEDKIYDIVTHYPELKERLLSLSKKFQKLNNPLVFNTVAKITTVRKAAEVGKIYINEMLYQLNDAIGLGNKFLEEKKKAIFNKTIHSNTSETSREKKEWLSKGSNFPIFDFIEKDEPFQDILQIAQNTEKGNGFIILRPFEPIPIIGYLNTLGFEHYTEQEGEKRFKIYFYRSEEKI